VLFRAHLLSPGDAMRLLDVPDGGLAVDAAGRILAAGPWPEVAAALPLEPVQDLRPLWLLPGLVDLHSHLPQYPAVAVDGLELLPWLDHCIFPAERRFADPERAATAARIYFLDQLALGGRRLWLDTTPAPLPDVGESSLDFSFGPDAGNVSRFYAK